VCTVNNGGTATITCAFKPLAGWPDGGFYVNVTTASLSVAGAVLPDCSDTQATRRQVNIIKKPVVDITLRDEAAGSVKQVCSNATYVSLGYTVSSGASLVDVILTEVVARLTESATDAALTSVVCELPDTKKGELELA
jgi:hypothetical protein